MKRPQYISVLISIVLLLILFFGFENKPAKQLLVEKSRAENFEITSVDLLMREGLNSLSPNDRLFIEKKIQLLGSADSASVDDLIEMSSEWYKRSKFALSGYYAEKIANLKQDEESWSIAGTTFANGLRSFSSEKERAYCAEKAENALQMAASLNPGNVSHKINLAICYADYPPAENPMKGILMLLSLQEENPENTTILTTLGRLAIQTGQFDKAKVRLEKVVELLPNNKLAYCMLSDVYLQLGETNKSSAALENCKKL